MCLLAFVGRSVLEVLLDTQAPLNAPTALGVVITLAGFAAYIGVPVALVIAYLSPRRHPAVLDVDATKARFVTPGSVSWRGPAAILLAWISGPAATELVERAPDGDGVRLVGLSGQTALTVTMIVLCFAAAAFLLFANRPRLVIDQAGLTIQRLAGTRRVRWDDLQPGGPPPPTKQGLDSKITLYLRPPDPHTAPAQLKVPAGQLNVNPQFLAATIRHYVERPQRRHDIGTDAELTRLQAALAQPYAGTP